MNCVWIELHGTITSPAPGGSGRSSISPMSLGQKRSATRPAETTVVRRVRFSMRIAVGLLGNSVLPGIRRGLVEAKRMRTTGHGYVRIYTRIIFMISTRSYWRDFGRRGLLRVANHSCSLPQIREAEVVRPSRPARSRRTPRRLRSVRPGSRAPSGGSVRIIPDSTGVAIGVLRIRYRCLRFPDDSLTALR